MFSIASSWFNVSRMKFDWKAALENWLAFLGGTGQIVIVINTSDDESPKLVRDWLTQHLVGNPGRSRIDVIDAALPYDDPEFDGKLKALALSHCAQPYAILLDCDERLVPHMRPKWMAVARELENNGRMDAVFVPVVDLFQDERHYKSVGQKWYLHKVRPEITRGVVKWAYREDGSIDTSKSDTCELIYRDSRELVRTMSLLIPGLPAYMQIGQMESGEIPFVYHLGWLDKEQRLRQSEFWRPVWSLRDGKPVETESTLEELDKIQKFPHRLPAYQ